MNKQELKELIEEFYDKWQNTDGLWRNSFSPKISEGYKEYTIKISFGQGIRIVLPKNPWMAFLKYNQQVSKGIYPIVIIQDNLLKVFLGISKENDSNLELSFIEKLKEKLGYKEFTINDINDLLNHIDTILALFDSEMSSYMEDSKNIFIKNYNSFIETLPMQGSGKYAKLFTSARQIPFKLYRNSANGIAINAFTEQSAPMSTNLQQLLKVVFENSRLWYTSYEPIIIKRIQNNDLIKEQEVELEGGNIEIEDPMLNKIKNIILYGSPGVGKTHNTNKLIRLIEDSKSDREIFETIKANENSDIIDISDINERVKFITFHQSFGYEDFIEGFRPNEEGNIGLEKGIFLEICNDAEENLLKSSEERKVPFKEAFNRLFKEKIEKEESVKIDLKRTGSYFKVNDFNDKTIYFEKQSGTTKHTLSITSLEKMYDVEKNDFINGGLAVYYEPILEKLLKIKRESHVEKVERKNYYLVIDEINRGNISKIFGELITFIEEDKRDTLEVTLPYSKKLFKIPSNLYIIGTMNSTDKSIALIDIALRRRFTFLKMKPNENLITSHAKAKKIFNNLNERITRDLGEDYQIGHSYFMKIQNDDDLDFVLDYKIIPLLEEYYYGDDRLPEVIALCKQDTTWGNDE